MLGHSREVQDLCTGGFELDVPFTPTALRELAKMDGAIVLDGRRHRIVRAGVHLMPDAAIVTAETGTRHRTADRVARQTGVPVIAVSASMATISLYVDDLPPVRREPRPDPRPGQPGAADAGALPVSAARGDHPACRRSRSRTRSPSATSPLVAQRLEMVHRLDLELSEYAAELGTEGRLLALQMHELTTGLDRAGRAAGEGLPAGRSPGRSDQRRLHVRHHRRSGRGDAASVSGSCPPSTPPSCSICCWWPGPSASPPSDQLDSKVTTRGYRQVAQINRLPGTLGERLIEHFGSLQALFAASRADLQEVEGVGEQRARAIRDGLVRVAESAYADPAT